MIQGVVHRSLHWCVQVHLPSAVPEGLMQVLVDECVQRRGLQQQDVQRLLEWSGMSPALFVTLIDEWDTAGRPADQDAFVSAFMRTKMEAEVRKSCMRVQGGQRCRWGLWRVCQVSVQFVEDIIRGPL